MMLRLSEEEERERERVESCAAKLRLKGKWGHREGNTATTEKRLNNYPANAAATPPWYLPRQLDSAQKLAIISTVFQVSAIKRWRRILKF
jgi:hypothetical protein